MDEATRKLDRGFFGRLLGMFAVAVVLIVIGLLVPPVDDGTSRGQMGPTAAVILGVSLIGYALVLLVGRLRRRPQKPGRHTRP